MGFGTGTDWKNVYSFNVYSKKGERPYFKTQKKEGDKWTDLPQSTFVEGYIYGIIIREVPGYEEGTTEKIVMLKMHDQGNLYMVNIRSNQLGRPFTSVGQGHFQFLGIANHMVVR